MRLRRSHTQAVLALARRRPNVLWAMLRDHAGRGPTRNDHCGGLTTSLRSSFRFCCHRLSQGRNKPLRRSSLLLNISPVSTPRATAIVNKMVEDQVLDRAYAAPILCRGARARHRFRVTARMVGKGYRHLLAQGSCHAVQAG